MNTVEKSLSQYIATHGDLESEEDKYRAVRESLLAFDQEQRPPLSFSSSLPDTQAKLMVLRGRNLNVKRTITQHDLESSKTSAKLSKLTDEHHNLTATEQTIRELRAARGKLYLAAHLLQIFVRLRIRGMARWSRDVLLHLSDVVREAEIEATQRSDLEDRPVMAETSERDSGFSSSQRSPDYAPKGFILESGDERPELRWAVCH
ncbi:hypothetical protein ACLX1H_011312 [Fusarium chlamydosporum]